MNPPPETPAATINPAETPPESSNDGRSGAIADGVPDDAWIRTEAERLAGLDTPDLRRTVAVGVGLIDARVLELNDDQLDTAFLPAANVGQWPARVALGHLADREVRFAAALRRALSEHSPVLEPWDPDALIDAGLYRGRGSAPFAGSVESPEGENCLSSPPPVAGFLATVHTLRRWTMDVLGALEDHAWSRPLIDPDAVGTPGGAITVRDLVAAHAARTVALSVEVSLKVEKFLGPMPEEGCGEPGSCGMESCACRGDSPGNA